VALRQSKGAIQQRDQHVIGGLHGSVFRGAFRQHVAGAFFGAADTD
jgi:hypothetical protein